MGIHCWFSIHESVLHGKDSAASSDLRSTTMWTRPHAGARPMYQSLRASSLHGLHRLLVHAHDLHRLHRLLVHAHDLHGLHRLHRLRVHTHDLHGLHRLLVHAHDLHGLHRPAHALLHRRRLLHRGLLHRLRHDERREKIEGYGQRT